MKDDGRYKHAEFQRLRVFCCELSIAGTGWISMQEHLRGQAALGR